MNRSIRFLYMALAAGFGLLVLMLGYWQVVVAGELVERADNPYQLQKQRLVNRGRIISADSVMDPFAAEWAAIEEQREEVKEWKEVKGLLDLPDEVLRLLANNSTHLAEI